MLPRNGIVDDRHSMLTPILLWRRLSGGVVAWEVGGGVVPGERGQSELCSFQDTGLAT